MQEIKRKKRSFKLTDTVILLVILIALVAFFSLMNRQFIAYNNGTVLDTKTNLMWAAKDNGFNINWQNAKSYCENYRGGGYRDWRMPTQDELASLYDETIINTTPPAMGCKGGYHLTSLIRLTCCCPWATETRGSKAAYFGFNKGPRAWLDESYVGGIRVLPVRTHE